MVSRAHRHALMIQQHSHVVRMDVAYEKRDDRGFVRCLPDNPQTIDSQQFLGAVLQQLLFVVGNVLDAGLLHVFDGFAQSDDIAHRRCTCLKLEGQFVVGGLLKRHGADHFATALIRLHLLEPTFLAVHHADAHRGVHFVSGETIEVTIQRLHIHGAVSHRLRTVHHHGHMVRVRDVNDFFYRIDGAQAVGDVRHGNDPGPRSDECL